MPKFVCGTDTVTLLPAEVPCSHVLVPVEVANASVKKLCDDNATASITQVPVGFLSVMIASCVPPTKVLNTTSFAKSNSQDCNAPE